MIPSSNNLPKLCSNNQCRKIATVLGKGWVSENNRKVDLCNGCYVSFIRGKFCEVHHGTMSGWKRCTSCTKPIHSGCVVYRSLYVRSEPRGSFKCRKYCAPQHDILIQQKFVGTSGTCSGVSRLMAPRGHVASPPLVIGSSKITNNELTTPTPLARVPPVVVGKGKENVVSEKGDEQQPRTPPLFCEYKGESSNTTSDHQYVPRFTEQEFKQMSRGLKVEATPLFEKVLTVSDAGKSGRLVIPKKCAEDHFPSIEKIPEGKALVFEDGEGKDWEFHYRYWPNNNSRMYVLEGFNIYVTSMKLKAGDTVLFSRLEPEGKLVMGHRNSTSASSSTQGMVTEITTNGLSENKTTPAMTSMVCHVNPNDPIYAHSDMVGAKASVHGQRKRSEMGAVKKITTTRPLKDKTTSAMPATVSHENPNNPINVDSDVLGSKSSINVKRKNLEMIMLIPSTSKRLSKPRTILALPSTVSQTKPKSFHSNVVGLKSPIHRKRKLYEIGLTSKSSDHEEKMANLALSFQRGQELIQSCPGSNPPSEMFLDGVEIKSYKDDPIIGRPSMFTKLHQCGTQWAQCKKCYKWRKVSVDIEIPANWTCWQNHGDLLRSRCSTKEELTRDMINNTFPANNQGSLKKIKTGNVEPERVETVEDPDVVVVTPVENTLALPEHPKANKKHPRHRPGCACIVCMQAPSGSKHKPSCKCCSCTTRSLRRRVLNPRRGKKRSKNAARRKKEKTKRSTSNRKTQKAHRKQENAPNLPEIENSDSNLQMVVIHGSEGIQHEKNVSGTDTKYHFDLNLLPEPDEDDI